MLSPIAIPNGFENTETNLPNQEMCLSKWFNVSETHETFSFNDPARLRSATKDLKGAVWLNAAALKDVKHSKSYDVLCIGLSPPG